MVTDARKRPIEAAPPADRVGHRAQSSQGRILGIQKWKVVSSVSIPGKVFSQLSRWFVSIWKRCSRSKPSHREPPGLLFWFCPLCQVEKLERQEVSPMARLMGPEFAQEAVGSFGNNHVYVACHNTAFLTVSIRPPAAFRILGAVYLEC